MENIPNSSSSPCTIGQFPFDFLGSDRNPVDGVLNAQGQCIFPAAQCDLESSVDACCKAKPEAAATGSNYMFFGFLVTFIPYMYLRHERSKRRAAAAEAASGKKEDNKTAAKDGEEKEEDKNMDVPSWVKRLPCSGFLVPLFTMGLWIQITMQILIPILMRNSLQAKLDVSSRNALIAAEAFLIPYREILQFIEDIVLVRVNYALARGDKDLTNRLVHAGMVGSFGTGVVAAVIATILGVIPAALEAVTNPGVERDMELYPGCDLIGDNDNVLPYWLMEVFAIPGEQLGKVMSGFMLGAMELAIYGWIGAISLAMIPTLWYSFNDVVDHKTRLLLLSSAEFTAAWMLPLLSILYIVSPLGANLRENTGVNLRVGTLFTSFKSLFGGMETPADDSKKDGGSDMASPHKAAAEEHTPDESHTKENAAPAGPSPESTKTLLVEGLKIMVMDVVIQCCTSISIYLALSKDASVAYQLTALQSALPTYGIAYAFGMGIMFKVVGPQLIAGEHFQMFAALARVTCICSFLLIPLIMGAVIPFRSGMAFDYGANACAYAKDDECLPFFANVFGPNAEGGDFTLSSTFDVFAAGASVDAILFILRAMLLSLVDLDFMLKGTAVAVVFYIPAIIVATTVEPFAGQASALFVAMYVPQLILIVMFALRLHVLIQRMLQGKQGTWSSTRNLNIRNSVVHLEDLETLKDAITDGDEAKA